MWQVLFLNTSYAFSHFKFGAIQLDSNEEEWNTFWWQPCELWVDNAARFSPDYEVDFIIAQIMGPTLYFSAI